MSQHYQQTKILSSTSEHEWEIRLNLIWTGLLPTENDWGGGQMPPPNLTILSQMTMKLAKDILCVEIFTN